MGKKKLLCCILALALACTALAGCASREAGLKALVSKDAALSPQPTASATVTPAPTPTATPEPTPAKEPESAYRPGELSEDGYISTWLGLQFTPPKGMIMLDEEQMRQSMQAGGQVILDEEGQQMMEEAVGRAGYEMMCVSSEGDNVNMLVEEAPVSLSERQYLTLSQSQVEKAFTSQGMTITFGEIFEQEIGGVTFAGLPYTVGLVQPDAGIDMSMDITSFVQIKGKHYVVMTVTSATADGTETILSGFSPLDL